MKINKIAIIGGSGSGKTTLAKNLEKISNIPVFHIDGINYFENWVERDRAERDQIILDKLKEDKWIIDGTYNDTLEARVKEADLVIFLDYSTFAKIKGIVGRYLKNPGKEKEEIPGCNEQLNWKFIKFVLNWNRKKRKPIMKILENYKEKTIIFRNRKQLNKWYKEQFGKEIEI